MWRCLLTFMCPGLGAQDGNRLTSVLCPSPSHRAIQVSWGWACTQLCCKGPLELLSSALAPAVPAGCSKPPVQSSILHILAASPASQAAPSPSCSQEQFSRNQSRVLLCERPFKGAIHSSQQETIAHLLLRLWPLQGHSVSSSFPNTLYWFLLRAIVPLWRSVPKSSACIQVSGSLPLPAPWLHISQHLTLSQCSLPTPGGQGLPASSR